METRMEVAQAAHITRLSEQVKKLQKEVANYRAQRDAYEKGYTYYMMLQDAAKKHPAVMDSLQQLLTMVRLTTEGEIKGLTSTDDNQAELF